MSLLERDMRDLSVEELDRLAWRAICEWPKHTNTEVVRDGLDFSILTRYFLWDKVGRAIRREIDREGAEFEEELLHSPSMPVEISAQTIRGVRGYLGNVLHCRRMRSELRRASRGRPLALVPNPSVRLAAAVRALVADGRLCVVAPRGFDDCEGIWRSGEPREVSVPGLEEAERLHGGILSGLANLGIKLLERDREELKCELVRQARHMSWVEAQLELMGPDVLILPADNYPPVQEYVFLGSRMNIPSVVVQHGLDCERYYLDEAYATAIAVWGEGRRQRYLTESTHQPAMAATGNPGYDDLRYPDRHDTTGDYWLWATRPHRPEKCHAPSRSASEGMDILHALVESLASNPEAKLIIRPHPFDYGEKYQFEVERLGIADRIEISTDSLGSLCAGASIVISEDSTAGMDAMFYGKTLIHAHFAPSAAVVPFVKYGAALEGHSSDGLRDSLAKAGRMTAEEGNEMLEGQRSFLKDHAGLCDGNAGRRVVDFVASVVDDSRRQIIGGRQ